MMRFVLGDGRAWRTLCGVRIFLFLLLALPLLGQDVRVLTFNIRYNNFADGANAWPLRKEAVAKLIKDEADVAGLQEVKPDQHEWLVQNLPEFGFIGVGRDIAGRDESIPLIYRKDRFELLASGTFWLSETPEEAGSTTWGNKLPRICTWAKLRDSKANTAFWFYNVHLDHQSALARERGLALVADRMEKREGKEPAILVGDLNTSVGSTPLKALAARERPALISTYDALEIPAEGTFHGFTGKAEGRAIDYIFVEKDRWEVKSGRILKTTYPGTDHVERPVSDHFPVSAKVAIKSQSKPAEKEDGAAQDEPCEGQASQ